jgi:hypothetical protein
MAQKYGALGREIKETVYNTGYFGRLGEVDDAPRDSDILGTVRGALWG